VGLRGRAAWIEAARGRRTEAIRRIRLVLDERPSYAWGWLHLAEWCGEANDSDAALEAAGWLVRLTPGDSTAWAQLGRFQLGAGRLDEGRASLRRALELDARHDWAGAELLDSLIDHQELDEAAAVAARLTGADNPWLLSSKVRLAAARGDRAAASSGFRDLCALSTVPLAALEPATDALAAAGWADAAGAVLQPKLARPAVAPDDLVRAYGLLEAARWHRGRDLDVFAAFVRQDPRGPLAGPGLSLARRGAARVRGGPSASPRVLGRVGAERRGVGRVRPSAGRGRPARRGHPVDARLAGP
jgi:predicted Zn-dependent protease